MSMDQHYVEFLFPGAFLANASVVPVESREATPDVPDGAYGWRFYTRSEVEQSGERLTGMPRDFSPWTYVGEALTADDIRALDDGRDYTILLGNMRCNRWDRVCRTRAGNFVSMEPGDRVVSPTSALEDA